VFRLRLGSASLSQIAEEVRRKAGREGWGLPKGYDKRHVSQDLSRYQEEGARQRGEELRVAREIALERLRRLLMGLWPEAMAGDKKAIAEASKLAWRIARLQGLAPGGQARDGDGSQGGSSP